LNIAPQMPLKSLGNDEVSSLAIQSGDFENSHLIKRLTRCIIFGSGTFPEHKSLEEKK
jgi:hypothetical protein